MDEEILKLAYQLKEEIVHCEEYKTMKCKEKEMLDDEECSKLLIKYEKAKDEYAEAQRFAKYGSNLEEKQKQLSEIKVLVYENNKVQAYNDAYRAMNKKIKNLNNIVFDEIIDKKKEIEL